MIAIGDETGRRRDPVALGAAGGLALAAAPTFAVMAVLAYIPGGGTNVMHSPAAGGLPLSGMVPMYVLMSVFHSVPWVKLIARRRRGARRLPQKGLYRSG